MPFDSQEIKDCLLTYFLLLMLLTLTQTITDSTIAVLLSICLSGIHTLWKSLGVTHQIM